MADAGSGGGAPAGRAGPPGERPIVDVDLEGFQHLPAALAQAIKDLGKEPDPLVQAICLRKRVPANTTLPTLELHVIQYLVDPYLWILRFTTRPPDRSMMMTADGPGLHLSNFERCMERHFPGATVKDLADSYFALFQATISWQPAHGGPDMMLDHLEPFIVQASSKLRALEAAKISRHLGNNAGKAYLDMQCIDPKEFPIGSGFDAALKKLAYLAGKRGRNGEDIESLGDERKCNRCGEPVKRGTFKQHNKICKRK